MRLLRHSRALVATLAAALVLGGCAAPRQPSAGNTDARIRLLAQTHIAAGTEVLGTPWGGISGIDYDPQSGQFWLISDDRSAHAPARIYTARWAPAQQPTQPPHITGVFTLLTEQGQPFPSPPQRTISKAEVPDAEAIRWHAGRQRLWWTSEGDWARGGIPRLREALPTGQWARDIPLPPAFTPTLQPQRTGPRLNASLEGLAFSDDGCTAWLAMEMAWVQDGPRPTVQTAGGPVRITALDVATGQAQQQRAYTPDAVPRARRLPWGPEVNGVSEILADGPHHLLVLERDYSAGAGFGARLYRADLRSGSDTLGVQALQPGNHTPLQKTLLLDFATLGLATVDNLEGMTWAAPLPSGERVLVLVSDDNFNAAQSTQWLALAYPPAESAPPQHSPTCAPPPPGAPE